MKVKVPQSCLTLCNPMNCSLPGSSVHGILLARKLKWVASHSFLQEIFWTQGSNPALLPCRPIHYHLSHQGSPCLVIYSANFLFWQWATSRDKNIYHTGSGKRMNFVLFQVCCFLNKVSNTLWLLLVFLLLF